MKVDKILKKIVENYTTSLGCKNDNSFKYNINKDNFEVTFYHVIWNDNLNSFRNSIKSLNHEILEYVQSNFFYKVIRIRENLNDRFATDNALVYINRIQLIKLDKSPKNSHLAIIKSLKDLYV